jgi:hypothetical protein
MVAGREGRGQPRQQAGGRKDGPMQFGRGVAFAAAHTSQEHPGEASMPAGGERKEGSNPSGPAPSRNASVSRPSFGSERRPAPRLSSRRGSAAGAEVDRPPPPRPARSLTSCSSVESACDLRRPSLLLPGRALLDGSDDGFARSTGGRCDRSLGRQDARPAPAAEALIPRLQPAASLALPSEPTPTLASTRSERPPPFPLQSRPSLP